ncbi:MAG: prolyl oligopeptidase family serine peptidase [Verrucomicrobia bacterium]|nr:prolyl oligopeptidase family serine peptidase [Verrucomicrobiota bacterium]
MQNEESILLDGNVLAEQRDYLEIGFLEVSPDNQWLAYAIDDTGDELYEIRFLHLTTGRELQSRILSASYSGVWAADSRHFYYVRENRKRRPHAVFMHALDCQTDTDVLVYKERDPKFFVDVSQSQDGCLIFFSSESKTTTEVRYRRSEDVSSRPRLVAPRSDGVRYFPDHHDGWLYLRTNRNRKEFSIQRCRLDNCHKSEWCEVLHFESQRHCKDMLLFKEFMVSLETCLGQDEIRILELQTGLEHPVTFPDSVYVLEDGTNMEFDTLNLRLQYSALHIPERIYNYNMRTRELTLLKEQQVPGGHNSREYEIQRIYVPGADGTLIPATMVRKANLDLSRPHACILTGYGAYGIREDLGFCIGTLSFIERDCIYVVAHVRGGGFLGEAWYEAGKLHFKRNSFDDFAAVARWLIEQGYTTNGQLALEGASAGGLLVATVLNQNPGLCAGALAAVPFVDVLSSMMDPDLPLTTFEYEEWGDPNDAEDRAVIAAYSPVDNVRTQPYPAILITVGLQDPRVPYWEGLKWAERLRKANTGATPILVRANVGAGHSGASGRYETLRELAYEQAFLLDSVGLAEVGL